MSCSSRVALCAFSSSFALSCGHCRKTLALASSRSLQSVSLSTFHKVFRFCKQQYLSASSNHTALSAITALLTWRSRSKFSFIVFSSPSDLSRKSQRSVVSAAVLSVFFTSPGRAKPNVSIAHRTKTLTGLMPARAPHRSDPRCRSRACSLAALAAPRPACRSLCSSRTRRRAPTSGAPKNDSTTTRAPTPLSTASACPRVVPAAARRSLALAARGPASASTGRLHPTGSPAVGTARLWVRVSRQCQNTLTRPMAAAEWRVSARFEPRERL
eukprot:3939083-Rhodomonas_salina.1